MEQLLAQVAHQSPPKHLDGQVKSILDYRHEELVHRLQAKLDLTHAEAEVLFLDVKKYLYLCASTAGGLAPPPRIDAGWHEFLMYTRDYRDFCMDSFGNFIHHTPTPALLPHLISDPSATVDLAGMAFNALSHNWGIGQNRNATCDSRNNRPAIGNCQSECCPDHDCHGDASCGGDV